MGTFCALHPVFVIITSILICSAMTAGFYNFSVLTDPVDLWSPIDSVTRINKNYYDSHFRPFYRTTQLIIRPTDTTPWYHSTFLTTTETQYASTFQLEFLALVLRLQQQISNLKGVYENSTVSLSDICFAPLSPDNKNCTVQTILNYWQNDENNLRKVELDEFDQVLYDHISHFQSCIGSPTSQNDSLGLGCMGDFGGPIMPYIGMGGYPKVKRTPQYGNATALVITYIINNYKDPKRNEPAMAWEKAVIAFMKNYSSPNMTISFSTERSIQDELDRESQSDIYTILISYMAMFLYITLTLGNYKIFAIKKQMGTMSSGSGSDHHRYESTRIRFFRCFSCFESLMVDMKFSLGIAGVTIVLFSVSSSIGFFSYMSVKATLIIFEVIPFLVLAVGVDNIFILVQNLQRDRRQEDESLEEQVGRIVGKVGPSMLLTSSAESLAFLLGALTPMPAVRIFSLYAAMAVFIDFILQITCFVSLMTLDCKREASKRYNLFCCIKSLTLNEQFDKASSSKNSIVDTQPSESFDSTSINNQSSSGNNRITPSVSNPDTIISINEAAQTSLKQQKRHKSSKHNKCESESEEDEATSGLLFNLFKDYYAPLLMHKHVRPTVIILFMGLFCSSIAFLPKVSIGLDQKLSMPRDSYVLDYFISLEKYLSVGVPTYFVLKNVSDYSVIENQNMICATSGCNGDSMLNQINQASLQPDYTAIAIPANSWLDDYFDWLDSGDCCKMYPNNTYCSPNGPDADKCLSCPIRFQPGTNRPIKDDFYK